MAFFRLLILVSLTTLMYGMVNAQGKKNESVGSKINIQYQPKIKSLDSLYSEVKIYFNNGFKDTISAFLNAKKLFKKYLETDASLSYTNFNFKLSIVKNEMNYFGVCTPKGSFILPIDTRYKYLQISWYKNEWHLYYSDKEPVYL